MNRPTEIFLAAAVAGATLLLLLFPAVARGDDGVQPVPLVRTVNPSTVKPGEVAVASGDFLGKASVAELFLTDSRNDFRMEIVRQSEKEITFRVDRAVPMGRYRIAILIGGTEPKLLEQPVFLAVTGVMETPTFPSIPSSSESAARR